MDSLLQRFLDLNRDAFAAGEYEAAYHALMGAVHVADHAADMDAIALLAGRAAEQDAAIEAIRPSHRLSHAAALQRGHSGIFETAKTHVESVRLRHAATLGATRPSSG